MASFAETFDDEEGRRRYEQRGEMQKLAATPEGVAALKAVEEKRCSGDLKILNSYDSAECEDVSETLKHHVPNARSQGPQQR